MRHKNQKKTINFFHFFVRVRVGLGRPMWHHAAKRQENTCVLNNSQTKYTKTQWCLQRCVLYVWFLQCFWSHENAINRSGSKHNRKTQWFWSLFELPSSPLGEVACWCLLWEARVLPGLRTHPGANQFRKHMKTQWFSYIFEKTLKNTMVFKGFAELTTVPKSRGTKKH